ncbi:hypothetical protein Ancab_000886 [Ancistrocladus abbreviatus]
MLDRHPSKVQWKSPIQAMSLFDNSLTPSRDCTPANEQITNRTPRPSTGSHSENNWTLIGKGLRGRKPPLPQIMTYTLPLRGDVSCLPRPWASLITQLTPSRPEGAAVSLQTSDVGSKPSVLLLAG